MTTDEQFEKLPRHAQQTIRTLRQELHYAQQRIKELDAELSPVDETASRVSYEAAIMEGVRPMPEGSYFHFRLDAGEVRVMLQRTRQGKYFIDLNADQSLVVHPGSTNSVRITSVSRFDDL